MNFPPRRRSKRRIPASWARSLIDTFGKGWSKPNIDLLMSVFAPNAVFIETPFSDPIRGADAIRRWWLDVPFSQSEITFTSGEIYGAGPWFSTEFKCVFRRKRSGEWVDARGAIFCETEGGADHRDADVLASVERGAGYGASRNAGVFDVIRRSRSGPGDSPACGVLRSGRSGTIRRTLSVGGHRRVPGGTAFAVLAGGPCRP